MRAQSHRDFPRPYRMPATAPRQPSRFPAFLAGMALGAIIATVALARIMTHPAQGNPALDESVPAVDFRASDLPLPSPDPAPTGKLA